MHLYKEKVKDTKYTSKPHIYNSMAPNNLPNYVVYASNKAYTGYLIHGHPTLKNRRFASRQFTLDQLYAQCIAYLNTAN